jgi:phenylacetic acid degradation operon negative regulatory protein
VAIAGKYYAIDNYLIRAVIFASMAPTAKSLLLELLVASADHDLPVRVAIAAGALFGISENNVRVAFARLSSQGLIEAADRGAYRLTDAAGDLAREVAGWRSAEESVRAWHGAYVAVHSSPLGRTDRTALKRRARALSMLGFAELDRGFHVRPDNLDGGVEGIRARLYGLGLEREAAVFVASHFSADVEARARALWDGKALTLSYKKLRAQLEKWLARADQLEPHVAARESFLLGGSAIRHIVYDPLLPPPFVDVDERRSFVATARVMDREGRKIWRRFFDATGARSLGAVEERPN